MKDVVIISKEEYLELLSHKEFNTSENTCMVYGTHRTYVIKKIDSSIFKDLEAERAEVEHKWANCCNKLDKIPRMVRKLFGAL